MVAETSLIAITVIGTEGLDSSVLFVFFEEEGGIVDEGLGNGITENRTNQHVVDALPNAIIAIGALSTMTALGIACNVIQAICL